MTYRGNYVCGDDCASIASLARVGGVPIWTWQAVQDRMADARFSLGGRISSVWQQSFDEKVALIDMPPVVASAGDGSFQGPGANAVRRSAVL